MNRPMSAIPFWKTQTIGNHFVLIHGEDVEGQDLSALAVRLCAQHWSIGSDGLLVLWPPAQQGDPVEMRMFNPDGTEDFCGNGLRCATVHAAEQEWVEGEFVIRQKGIPCQVEAQPGSEAASWLPAASFEPDQIPFVGEKAWLWSEIQGFRGVALTTGSTHFVIPCEKLPSDDVFHDASPKIEMDPAFPERTSVMWVEALEDRRIKLRIWERGVGETLGCGTGSSASALVTAVMTGDWGEYRVENPGGTLLVTVTGLEEVIKSQSRVETPFFGAFS